MPMGNLRRVVMLRVNCPPAKNGPGSVCFPAREMVRPRVDDTRGRGQDDSTYQ